jgi:hypothetical protein
MLAGRFNVNGCGYRHPIGFFWVVEVDRGVMNFAAQALEA